MKGKFLYVKIFLARWWKKYLSKRSLLKHFVHDLEIFFVTFLRKTYLYGLLTRISIKQHLSLESQLTYFIQIVIEYHNNFYL